MKRLTYIFLAFIISFSCSTYDDSWIKAELDKQKEAVTAMESLCLKINSNISALESVISSLEKKDFIKSVKTIEENGKIVGYELIFQHHGNIHLYVGSDGKDGSNVHKPIISIKKDTDQEWYWTLDGEWCRDEGGNKVPAISNDDVTPSLKTEHGHWYISYNGGKSWEIIGIADGTDGDLIVSDISIGELSLFLTMYDGTVIEVPMLSNLSIRLGDIPSNIKPGTTFSVDYEITGCVQSPEVICAGEHGWNAKIVSSSITEGRITITPPSTLNSGKIVIFVSEGDVTIMKALKFEGTDQKSHIISSKYDYYEIDGTGGYIDVILTTNQEYAIDIPDEAKSWISHIETRSVRTDKIRFGISANPPAMPSREALITFNGTNNSTEVLIHQKGSPFIESEVDMGLIDGLEDPENGTYILQQASIENGTDIVIMGDGFSKRDFVTDGKYEVLMKQAYEYFFSIEPFSTLKEYFNVYYINVLSEEKHDAVPYYDSYGNQNGATQGTAKTRLSTIFSPGTTSIQGDNDLVLEYAVKAIETKGASNGGKCEYNEAYDRAHKAVIIVITNVDCYAGTCLLSWRSSPTIDYADLYSIAYCSLGNDGTGKQMKYTLIHEAGGHGFGKLGDEYSSYSLSQFNTYEWHKLSNYHNYGVHRNINEYWTEEESLNWSGLEWDFTTKDNVYWAELLNESYDYSSTEGLGLYKGANTYTSMFCRSTDNSVMNNQFGHNGQFFNAISRWTIWYRLMKLTDRITHSNFKSSIDEFIEFDKRLTINQNMSIPDTRSETISYDNFTPLGNPILVEYERRDNRWVKVD